MNKELSITYIPRHTNTLDNFYNGETIVLRQSFLDECELDFLHMMLCDSLNERLPTSLTEAIMAYSDQHNIEKDVTVVFRY